MLFLTPSIFSHTEAEGALKGSRGGQPEAPPLASPNCGENVAS